MKNYQNNILRVLASSERPIPVRKLIKQLNVKRKDLYQFYDSLDFLVDSHKVQKTPKGFTASKAPSKKKTITAVVVRIHDKFGFVKNEQTGEEIFIPGRFLMGAMPGDKVEVAVSACPGQLDEGKITTVVERVPYHFSGTIVKNEGRIQVAADRDFKLPIDIIKEDIDKVKVGDKVAAEIFKYGDSHFSHRARIIKDFGSADSAKNCCEAVLEANSISREFPAEAVEQAKDLEQGGIHPKEIAVRKDLRDENIFTIDGADTKDIDDAVSLKKLDKGWELGVHIADVSYYVYSNCALDKEAFKRGTSVYFADSVVPMLPKELSNGICSLNPGEDRLAFTARVTLDENADIKEYHFEKTVIRSKLKGVYSEINDMFAEKESDEIREKYKNVRDDLYLMKELAGILNKKRIQRGSANFESSEAQIVLDENGKAIDILPRQTGITENIIEEFMLVANEAAAMFAMREAIPFVYRVHEAPSPEKLADLKSLLRALGIDASSIKDDSPCGVLSDILKKVEGTRYEKLVNNSVLRAMSKAKYCETNLGHYGLVLQNYAHFTAPIRRYSDIAVHRIMTGLMIGMKRENIDKRYTPFAASAAKQASATELRAVNVERDCDDCYKAEYMKDHIGEEYEGIISAVTPHGIYIELPNTVEGMCKPEDIEHCNYVMDTDIRYKDTLSGNTISVGDSVLIKVLRTDVASGNIDFQILKKLRD